jgi:hypothetical protein
LDDAGPGEVNCWQFVVGEPLRGFLVSNAPWTKRAKEYVKFKTYVRLMANAAGVPSEIPHDKAVAICIALAWKLRARVDNDGVLKAITDGLFKKDRGVERVVCDRWEYTGKEEASVIVSFKERKSGIRKAEEGNLGRRVRKVPKNDQAG